MWRIKVKSRCVVWVHPDNDDGNEADRDEDDVEAEQQAVYDESHLDPLLWAPATTQVLVHLQAEGLQLSAQALQLQQSFDSTQWFLLYWRISFVRNYRGEFHFCWGGDVWAAESIYAHIHDVVMVIHLQPYLVRQDFEWSCLDLWASEEASRDGQACEWLTVGPSVELERSERSRAAGWWWG